MTTILIVSLLAFAMAYNGILSKQLLNIQPLSNDMQSFLWRSIGLLVLIPVMLFGFMEFRWDESQITWFNFGLLCLGNALLYIISYLRRFVMLHEKISVLQPYMLLSSVFVTVIAFIFIASERSIVTFWASIFAVLILIVASLKSGKMELSKYCAIATGVSFLNALSTFISLYFILRIGGPTFYILETIWIIVVSAGLISANSGWGEMRTISRRYFALFCVSVIIGVSVLLTIFHFYESLGVVATGLIGLLYLLFLYPIAYRILGEVPAKKDVVVAALISVCVTIGLIYK